MAASVRRLPCKAVAAALVILVCHGCASSDRPLLPGSAALSSLLAHNEAPRQPAPRPPEAAPVPPAEVAVPRPASAVVPAGGRTRMSELDLVDALQPGRIRAMKLLRSGSPAASAPVAVRHKGALMSAWEKQAMEGAISFTPDHEVYVGRSFMVEVTLQANQRPEALLRALKAEHAVAEALPVTEEMELQLFGEKAYFDISPLHAKARQVLLDQPTRWRWSVVPKDGGPERRTLTLEAMALFKVGKDEKVRSKVYEATVRVLTRDLLDRLPPTGAGVSTEPPPSRWMEFAKTNWQWLWTALLVPVVGAAWRKRTDKGGAPVTPEAISEPIALRDIGGQGVRRKR